MSNPVSYYEKQFAEARHLFSFVNSSSAALHLARTRLAGNSDQSDPKKINSDMAAAAAILKDYCDKYLTHHKEEANWLKLVACILTANDEALTKIVEKPATTKGDAYIRGLFAEEICKSKGFDISKPATQEQKDEIAAEMRKQAHSMSLDFQKNIFTRVFVNFLNGMTLAPGKSDFASLSFVIIKRLNLESRIPRGTMENVIRGANFSEGFLRCGSGQARRAEEMANLERGAASEAKVEFRL